MRLPALRLQLALLLTITTTVVSATSWTFKDGTLSIQKKGAGVGAASQEKLSAGKPLVKTISIGASDTLKISLTAQDGSDAKRPHQLFLLLKDSVSKLDISYPFNVKEGGKAKLELTQTDLPSQFLRAASIDAEIVIGSFGASKGFESKAFSLQVEQDPSAPLPAAEKPLRYGKLPEIHHIFRADPKSPPLIITLFFTAAVLVTFPVLLGAWLYVGGNLNHLSKALGAAPLSHALFYGSIVALEGVFFLYYTSWNLFQTLPAALALGAVTFLSGTRALTEVQERRLAGKR